MGAVLDVRNLRVELRGSGDDIVDEVSFQLGEGEVLGLVGDSGSGKTTVALALLGYARRGTKIVGGDISLDERDVLALPHTALREARGGIVAYVPQDPASALNPALRIGTQLEEIAEEHWRSWGAKERRARLSEVLGQVNLPDQAEFFRRYPHQLSGGQQQRVCIAMAFICRPRLIVLDEPTTGLDVTTQAHVLETVRDLCLQHDVAAVYVSHDLAVVAALAHRVAVMYAGRLVEIGPRDEIFLSARHPYTRRLVRAIPDPKSRRSLVGIAGHAPAPGQRPRGCFFAPRCPFVSERAERESPPLQPVGPDHHARCWRANEIEKLDPDYVAASEIGVRALAPREPALSVRALRARYGRRVVLHGVTLDVREGECLALVGESGSGKTTLARCIAGLHPDFAGEILFHGLPLARAARDRPHEVRQEIQYIFQNPYSSLNPRKTVGQILAQPLRLFERADERRGKRGILEALERVALSGVVVNKHPDQLSGGERQRVAIARALAAEPSVLVCDEVTSSLDVSVQAAIVNLLAALQGEMGLTLVFVTHNLALVRSIADHVVVMKEGHEVEADEVERIFTEPQTDYTRQLLANTPTLEWRHALRATADQAFARES